MAEVVKSWSWPQLVSSDVIPDGGVLTVSTHTSHARVIPLLNGNLQLYLKEGHVEARIELTPEAAKHLAKELSDSTERAAS